MSNQIQPYYEYARHAYKYVGKHKPQIQFMNHNRITIFALVVQLFTAIVIVVLLFCLHCRMGKVETDTNSNTSFITTYDDGDKWHTLQNGLYKVEWRELTNSLDSMAVIHIHQGDSLYTWIGKPCQCY